ncbi:efflux RND transporter periplasmic adaptor subunit [Colwellia psychrerythraea]|uniref:Efflux transporter, RND family, MFP subunit n=1 Tax=Colwellia psychrerythraea TaxID=28229 RepID=A0A099KXK1_COLPS|nr:efflux RND transporter periplasmic adaptor subunit [Colwellia psychrerythraea]KGJ94910.1 efflux transporter, RND family, MFP subunit [Colwellia psychrerythraea]
MRSLSFIIITLLLVGCNEPAKETSKPIRPIMWTKVAISPFEQIRTLSGIVAPVEATKLSFEVQGKIQSIAVNLGNEVVKGQELARLNQRNFNLGLQSAQAQYQQAKATLVDAQNSHRRYEKLLKQGVVSQSGFDNAKATYDASRSAADVAQAQLDIAKKNLQDSILLAPYDGIITKRLFEPSQQISAGQSLFEIEGNHGLEVHVMVPETLIRELTQHAIIPISFPVLPELTIQGQITEIGTRAEFANAFPVTVVLQGDNPLLRAGMTAEVEFSFAGTGRTGHKGDVFRIPATALSAGLAQKVYVFVYNPQSQQVIKTQVQTENIFKNEVFVSSGLKAGDIIATAGVAFLRDGQQVSLTDNTIQRFN